MWDLSSLTRDQTHAPCRESTETLITELQGNNNYFLLSYLYYRAILVAQLVKNPPALQETLIQFLGQEDGEGIGYPLQDSWVSLLAELVKNLPTKWETWV